MVDDLAEMSAVDWVSMMEIRLAAQKELILVDMMEQLMADIWAEQLVVSWEYSSVDRTVVRGVDHLVGMWD